VFDRVEEGLDPGRPGEQHLERAGAQRRA
jgi:hypothetical protein